MKLSIIIPVYNEEKTIAQVLHRLRAIKLNTECEIIVVDDGSTDATWSTINKQLTTNNKLKILQHKKNMGKGAAVNTGIKQASGDYIIIQDADLEYDPEYIKKLIIPIKNGTSQVVYGTRLKRLPNLSRDERTPLFLLHYFGNRFLSFLTSLLYGHWITDMETGYKIFPKKALEKVALRCRSFDFEPEITAKLLKNGYKILEISIRTNPRGYNEGKKLNTVKDGLMALWTLIKFRFTN